MSFVSGVIDADAIALQLQHQHHDSSDIDIEPRIIDTPFIVSVELQ